VKDVVALMKALGTSARRPASPAPTGNPDVWLFAGASQPVLIVDLATDSIIEANPAAATLLGMSRADLIGNAFITIFAADSAPALTQSMATARLAGSGKRVTARTRGGRGSREVGVTLSVVRAQNDSYLLARMVTSPLEAAESGTAEVSSMVLDVIEKAPEGFVVTDLGLRVSYANRAFIDLAGLESPGELRGKSLAHWLELSQMDLARLHDQMARREAVTVWKTTLRRSSFSTREVEVTAVAVPDGNEGCWGFRISAIQFGPMAGAI
jgi:PAS domain S-box-containing protein